MLQVVTRDEFELLTISWTVLVAVDFIMAKRDKDPTPNPASISNKDIIQRLNFLYQASVYLSNLSRDIYPTDVASSALITREEDQAHGKAKNAKSRHAKQSRRRPRTTEELSRAYVHTMTTVGKRATVKMCVSASNIELDADLIIYPTVLIRVCT